VSYQDDVALVLEAMGMIAGTLTETGERCWIVPDGPVIDIDANFIVERVIPEFRNRDIFVAIAGPCDEAVEWAAFTYNGPEHSKRVHAPAMPEAVMAALAAALRAE